MPPTQQLELSQRLFDDDEQVLEEILRTYGPAVSFVLTRRYLDVLSAADIEDALSVGLFRLWNSRQRFDPQQSSLKVWFFRIVENAVRDVLRLGWQRARQLEVRTEFIEQFQSIARDPPDETEPVHHAPSAQQLELREIIDNLPETQRAIVLADACSPDGTADSQRLARELNVATSSVRVYRKRALDRIRQEMRDRGHDVP